MQLEVGNVIAAVWRPGLYYQSETPQALGGSETDVRSTEQALRMLVERLDELLLYVEPSANGLASYSHKTRELLILACTEAENQMKRYLTLANCPREGGLNTRDYVRLAPKLYLSEYVIALKPYQDVESLKPFRGWEAARPTQSLPWYDAYNKTKHDRTSHFSEATLANCLAAVAANVVLFCTRWSPFFLIDGSGPLSSLVKSTIQDRASRPRCDVLLRSQGRVAARRPTRFHGVRSAPARCRMDDAALCAVSVYKISVSGSKPIAQQRDLGLVPFGDERLGRG